MKVKRTLLVFSIASVWLSCSKSFFIPEDRNFNFSLKYGILARNHIDTFHDTFTKDLILNGTISVPFVLSEDEFSRIQQKLLEIDFFSYPDTFVVELTDSLIGYLRPHPTYLFKVKLDSITKALFWEDEVVTNNPRAINLRAAINSIIQIIESKPEYRRLPPAKGGYI